MKTLFTLGLVLCLSAIVTCNGADSTIHGLPAKAAPDDTDLTVIDDGVNNFKATIGAIRGSTAPSTILNMYITTNFVYDSFTTNLTVYNQITYETNIINYLITTNVDVVQNITVNSNLTVLETNINNVTWVTNYIKAKTAYITNLYAESISGFRGYIVLASPFDCDGVGTKIYTNANNVTYFGQAQFNNAADQAANYCDYYITVPEDLDTAVDLKVARFKFQLSAADTGTHRYVISLSSVADSAAYAGSLGNAVNLDFAGDASGAQGDVETVANVTLTNWKSNMTKGQLLVIRVARDGNDAADASTVDSFSGPIVISYGVSQ